MPILISLNEDGTIHGELNTSVKQLSTILRKAIAEAPVGNDNPEIKIEFGVKKITVADKEESKKQS